MLNLFIEAGLVFREEQGKRSEANLVIWFIAFVGKFVDAVLFVKIISWWLLVVLGSKGDTL
jgi:hypothetical protein